METMVESCIVTGYGINADEELEIAFTRAGSAARRVHINDLIDAPDLLDPCGILAFPGGFSFGDHLGSGLVLSALIRSRLREHLQRFIDRGNLVIGICNGFQVLVKMGILPNIDGEWRQRVSLVHNDSGVFENRWVRVRFNPASPCVWTRGLTAMDLPVRHGEGKFIADTPQTLRAITHRNLDAVTYLSKDNPNGSEADIAGVCDPTGRVFGLMPHPEAFISPLNHPRWSRDATKEGAGLHLFRNAVAYAQERQEEYTSQVT